MWQTNLINPYCAVSDNSSTMELELLPVLLQKEHLSQQGLCTGHRIYIHDHNIFHIVIPTSHNMAFRLDTGCLKNILTLVVAKQFIAGIPDRIIGYSRRAEDVHHLRPDRIMPPDIFFQLSRQNSGLPSISLHNRYLCTRPEPSPAASFSTSETETRLKPPSIECFSAEAATANSIAAWDSLPDSKA